MPIYPTLTPDQAAFIVNDCGAKVIFIQGGERFDQMLRKQRTMPDLEHLILIDGEPPKDGEILARGPQIMHGYFNMPEATAEAIDSQGWFHTGDIGEIDSDGFLRITDRKKEIIVNAYGKNVAPAPIENALKSSPFIGQAVVIGDRRKFLSALLVPDFDALTSWARRQGLADEDLKLLIGSPPVKELVKAEVERVNLGLARYEQVRTRELLVEDFTIETGELTPTQKIKRRVINRKFGHLVEEMYERAEKSQSEDRR